MCSCLVLAAQAEGREVVTVEGIAPEDGLHEVQQAFVEAGAVQCGFCTPGLIVASHDLLSRNARPSDPEIREALAGNLCRCTGYEKILDAVRIAGERMAERGMSRIVIEGCAIATVDAAGTEHADGHIVIEDGRILAVGAGPAPATRADVERIDGRGRLATPGLVNCHHHLYQWATRGLAQQATLFEWLTELYPAGRGSTARSSPPPRAPASPRSPVSGCTTSTDHHYVFPAGAGDLLEVEIDAARAIGLRFHPCRGSMDLGRSRRRLPPDEVVEDRDVILAASEAAIDRFHDPAPDSMLRIALAPCSPFSVTRELMADSAELARQRGVRLHTHLAETLDEEEFCLQLFGVRPVEYLEDVGWLGDDVWLAHCVHLNDDEIGRFGETGTGVAHCATSNARLGAGIAPVVALRRPARRSASASTAPRRTRAPSCGRAAPGAARRPPGGRAGGHDGARGARARDDRGRPLPRPRGRARLARAGQARRRRPLARRRPRCTRASRTRWPRSCSAPPPRGRHAAGRRPRGRRRRRAADGRRGRAGARPGEASRKLEADGRRRRDDAIPEIPVREAPVTPIQRPNEIGVTTTRIDGIPKVRGEFEYSSDMHVEGMLLGATLRSPHPRADIWSIDIARRSRCPACTRCSRTTTCPAARSTAWRSPTSPCWPGSTSATRARRSRSSPPTIPRPPAARSKAIGVEYEVLPPLTDAEAAMKPGAPQLHLSGNMLRHLRINHGDPDATAESSSPASTRSGCRTRRSSAPSPASRSPTARAASTSTSRRSGCTSTATRSAESLGLPPRRCG